MLKGPPEGNQHICKCCIQYWLTYCGKRVKPLPKFIRITYRVRVVGTYLFSSSSLLLCFTGLVDVDALLSSWSLLPAVRLCKPLKAVAAASVSLYARPKAPSWNSCAPVGPQRSVNLQGPTLFFLFPISSPPRQGSCRRCGEIKDRSSSAVSSAIEIFSYWAISSGCWPRPQIYLFLSSCSKEAAPVAGKTPITKKMY